MDKFPFNIVYLTDTVIDNKQYDITKRNAEGNSRETSKSLKDVLGKICQNVYFYDDIKEFSQNILTHKNDVVFTTLYGEAFESSKAQVPAICEANNIKFVGASSYTQMLCNDKSLSKSYAQSFGINTANEVLIRNPNSKIELDKIKTLSFPVVVKPNYGGGSNGISENNIKYNEQETIDLIKRLYKYQDQPILIEEYLEGYEIELIIFGDAKKIYLCEEVQLIIDNIDYYKDSIWGLEKKKIDDTNVNFSNSQYISPTDKEKFKRLFQSFRKAEFMRFDCRVNSEGIVYLIELSPDCYLGKDGGMYYPFSQYGVSYEMMLYAFIENAVYPDRFLKISPYFKKPVANKIRAVW